jgi:hypothetical protein
MIMSGESYAILCNRCVPVRMSIIEPPMMITW